MPTAQAKRRANIRNFREKQLCLLFVPLVLGPEAVDFADVASGDEGLDLLFADEVHQVGEFVLGQQGLDLDPFLALVAARHFVEAAPAHDLVDDVVPDHLMVVRDDADAFAPAQARHEVVHDQAVDPGADQADDDQPEGIDGERRAADDDAGDGHGQADVEMEVLVDDLRQDVQSSRGGVDAEHDGL